MRKKTRYFHHTNSWIMSRVMHILMTYKEEVSRWSFNCSFRLTPSVWTGEAPPAGGCGSCWHGGSTSGSFQGFRLTESNTMRCDRVADSAEGKSTNQQADKQTNRATRRRDSRLCEEMRPWRGRHPPAAAGDTRQTSESCHASNRPHGSTFVTHTFRAALGSFMAPPVGGGGTTVADFFSDKVECNLIWFYLFTNISITIPQDARQTGFYLH